MCEDNTTFDHLELIWKIFSHLELTLLDGQLTEEPVHYIAGQEKDICMTVLVHAHLHKYDMLEFFSEL